MKVNQTALPGVLLLEPRLFTDSRGYFFESYNQRSVGESIGSEVRFVQDNQAHSSRDVLRGMHYQVVRPQGKLVRVLSGAIYDVVVDLRRSKPSFGRWEAFELSAANHLQLWVPAGFAHGYIVTSDSADVVYKTTDYWYPEHERSIAWDDPQLAIRWPSHDPVLSDKDRRAASFAAAESFE